MSLINEMLRDLDARRASAAERSGLAPHVRGLPATPPSPWRQLVPVLAGAAVGAALLWLVMAGLGDSERPASPAAPVSSSQPAAPPVAASESAPAPVADLPPLVVALPELADPAGSDRGSAEDSVIVADLQLDRRLHRKSLSPPAVPKSSVQSNPPPAEPKPGETEPAIDKRNRPGSSAEEEFRKAMGLSRQGAVAEAMAGFQAALRLDGRHLAARQGLLSLLVAQRRWAEAQAVAAEGLAQDPAQTGWAMALARLQVEQGQLAEAESVLAAHAARGTGNADYLAFHALLLQKLQRPAAAADRYRAALVLRPDEGRWWYGLGQALDAGQEAEAALEAFAKARQTGNLPPALAALADQRLRQAATGRPAGDKTTTN